MLDLVFDPINPHVDIMPSHVHTVVIRTFHTSIAGTIVETQAACVHLPSGRCVGTVSLDRLRILFNAYSASHKRDTNLRVRFGAKCFQAELALLLLRYKDGARTQGATRTVKLKHHWAVPAEVMVVLQKYLHLTKERFASPLNFNPDMDEYWSMHERDQLFGAHWDAYANKWTGMSEANPEYEDADMEKAVRWALHSALTSELPTGTLLVLPDWTGYSNTAYAKWLKSHPRQCITIATVAKDWFRFTTPEEWRGGKRFSGTLKWGVKLVFICNEQARQVINMDNWRYESGLLHELAVALRSIAEPDNWQRLHERKDLGYDSSLNIAPSWPDVPVQTLPGEKCDGILLGKPSRKFLRAPADTRASGTDQQGLPCPEPLAHAAPRQAEEPVNHVPAAGPPEPHMRAPRDHDTREHARHRQGEAATARDTPDDHQDRCHTSVGISLWAKHDAEAWEIRSLDRMASLFGDEDAPLRHDWRRIAYTDGSVIKETNAQGRVIQLVGAGVFIPDLSPTAAPAEGRKILVNPGGSGPTNTVNRAELSAILAALKLGCRLIATDSACSMYMIRTAVLHPMLLATHKHRHLLEAIVAEVGTGDVPVTLYKVAAHTGLVGNEIADECARAAATGDGQVNAICTVKADPYDSIYWLRETETEEHHFLPNLKRGLTQHMRSYEGPAEGAGTLRRCHRLGGSNRESIYYKSWQATVPTTLSHVSNIFFSSDKVTLPEKKNCLKFRGGVLYNNNLAKKMGHSATDKCPLCGKPDGLMHMASACEHDVIARMVQERHNGAGRLLLKAIRNGKRGGDVVCADVGNAEKLAADGIRPLTSYLPENLVPHLTTEERAKLRPDIAMVEQRALDGPPDITLIEIKYCRDTNCKDQEDKAKAQHEKTIAQLTHADNPRGLQRCRITVVPILIGVSGTIFQSSLDALCDAGLTQTKAISTLTKIHLFSVKRLRSIVATRRALEHAHVPIPGRRWRPGGAAAPMGRRPTGQ